MPSRFRSYAINTFLKKFSSKKNSPLTLFQPLIFKIASLLNQDNLEGFNKTVIEYTTAVVENSSFAAGLLDADLNFITASPGWVKWAKRYLYANIEKKSDIKSLNFKELFTNCPKDLSQAFQDNMEGKSISHDSLEYDLLNGKKRWLYWESFPWLCADQTPCGVLFFCKDITSRYNMVLLNRKLGYVNEVLQTLSFMFSHDLIQPTRQVANFITLLENHLKVSNKQDNFIKTSLSSIKSSLDHMRALSEGVVMYCKEGSLTTNRQPVMLSKVISKVAESCFKGRNFRLRVTFTDDVILDANYSSMLQLFQNLLTNAIKYSISESPVVVLSGKKLKSGFFRFSIQNEGYQPMSHLNSDNVHYLHKNQSEGSGLGIMICKKIIYAYNGSIKFRSSEKYGTTVIFTLPLYQD